MLSLSFKRITQSAILLYLYFFLIPTTIYRAHGAYLFFQPERSSVNKGDQVQVKIKINSEGELPTTTDAVILFNSSQLNLIEVKESAITDRFFPKLFKRISNNKLFVGGAIEPGEQPKSGEGTIAVLVFEGLVQSENVVTFLCEQGKTTDSNINLKKNNKVVDVIDCGKVNQAAITVTANQGEPSPSIRQTTTTPGQGGSASPSLSPTANPSVTISTSLTPTFTPAPTSILSTISPASPSAVRLPSSGSVESVKSAVLYGLIFVGVSLIIRLFLKL